MKGKPWTFDEEKKLREMVQEHKKVSEMAAFFGKSPDCLKKKLARLNLKVVVQQISQTTTTELPSVEIALMKLDAALVALEAPGLDQVEILRLRSIVSGRKTYIEKFAEFLNYRELEARLIDLEGKYAALAKKAQNS